MTLLPSWPPRATSKVKTEQKGTKLLVTGDDWAFEFDTARGFLTRWTSDSTAILEPDPATGAAILPSCWRPPTDNDQRTSLEYWRRFGVDALTSQRRSFSINADSDGVIVEATTFLSPAVLDWGYEAKMEYMILSTGTLDLRTKLTPSGSFPKHIPRVGLNIRLNKALAKARWYGLGPGESYPDKKSAQRVGIWDVNDIVELHTPYEVPQENGNRMETGWVMLTEDSGRGVRARISASPEDAGWDQMKTGFSWAASRHTARIIEEANHPCDLVEEEATLLRLDARVAGVGTGACGPAVREDLMVKTEEIGFAFVLDRVGV